jgi:signal transduction histidine kinase
MNASEGSFSADAATASFDEVDISSVLASRPHRPPDYEAENRALAALAAELARNPQGMLQTLVESALALCNADTAGISLLETHDGVELFRWEAIAGVFAAARNGTMPRDASPCGVTIGTNATQLMYLADRCFPALRADPRFVEALLVPFHFEGKPIGTVWVVAHRFDRKFDQEDERVIRRLADFASAGWQLWQANLGLEQRVDERTAALSQINARLQDEIEARKRVEAELRSANDKVEMVLNSMTDRYYGFDREWRYTNLNQRAEAQLRTLGKDPTSLIGKVLWEEFPTLSGEESMRRAMREQVAVVCEFYSPLLGEWVENRIYPRPDQGLAVFQSYITERKRSEAALLQHQHELQALAAKLIEAQENGNKYLARELHDDFSHQLVVLGIEMAAEARLASSQELSGRLRKFADQVNTLATDIHRISRQLHPNVLYDLGLTEAIKNECAAFSRQSNIPIIVEPAGIPQILPDDISLCLYRVAQECLVNIGKHAKATEVRIILRGSSKEIVMEIADNGDGFDLETVKGRGGLGLISMEERVRLVDGTFNVRSKPAKGTVVTVRVHLIVEHNVQ